MREPKRRVIKATELELTVMKYCSIQHTAEDAAALRRLAADEQHMHAVKWIIEKACLYREEAFVPGYPDITASRAGRHHVGEMIVRLMKAPLMETKEASSVSPRRKRGTKRS